MSDLSADLNALRLRALQRDLNASDGAQTAAPVSTAAHEVEGEMAAFKESAASDDRIWREVQRRINAAEAEYIDRRALLNQHVIKAERTLAAAVTYQENICDPPARLGIPGAGASMEALINRARDVVEAQMEADQDGRDHLKDAVASTHKELWYSALQLTDVQ